MGLLSEISPITGWPFDPEDVSPSRALAEPSRISFDLAYNSRSAACKHAILMGNRTIWRNLVEGDYCVEARRQIMSSLAVE